MSIHTIQSPRFSIAICTYNGAKSIGTTIESLLSQKVENTGYEIIVIDDGSTDQTCEIVKKYPVTLISHPTNMGLATARNTGLKHSNGEIYVCFDDDCITHPNWLAELNQTYSKKPDAMGVGGYFTPSKSKSLLNKYLCESEYGNPAPSMKKPFTLYNRLIEYAKNTLLGEAVRTSEYVTAELSGANCSYPVSILNSVDGWIDDFAGIEDTDLCYRLRVKFPKKKFYVNKLAKLEHESKYSLWQYLMILEKRSEIRYLFYKSISKIPPLFPFPIILFFLIIFCFIYTSFLFLAIILCLPLLFYFSWIIKAVKRKKVECFLFPYIQLSVEFSMLLGIIIGKLKKW